PREQVWRGGGRGGEERRRGRGACGRGGGRSRIFCRATSRWQCMRNSRRCWIRAGQEFGRFKTTLEPAALRAGRVGPRSCCARPKGGRGRKSSMAYWSRGRSERTRSL